MRQLIILIVGLCIACKDEVGTKGGTLVVSPSGTLQLNEGDSIKLSAEYRDVSGNIQPAAVTWESSAITVVLVKPDGYAKALSGGTALVRAVYQGVASAPVELRITPKAEVVATVEVTTPTTTILVNESIAFSFKAKNADGVEIAGKAAIWQSDELDVLVINMDGVATGIAPGPASVSATVDGVKSNSVVITVN